MKIAFVFSGQGAQYVGMGKDLYETYDIVKKRLSQADEIFGERLTKIMFSDQHKLSNTQYAQPAIFAMSAAIRDLLITSGVASQGASGLSLGEYSAYYDQGVFDFEDGLRTIIHRAYFMNEAAKQAETSMVALLGSLEQAQALVDSIDDAYIANVNAEKQIVVGGSKEAMSMLVAKASEFGIKRAIHLDTSGAFHTPYMEKASKDFAEYVKNVKLNPVKDALYLNTIGERSKDDIKSEMVSQITSPVLFDKMIRSMIRDGFDCFVEIGPKDTLKRLIKKIDKKLDVFNIEDKQTFEAFMQWYKEMR